MVDVEDKLAYFQSITGVEDPAFCTEILAAHDWDLELAISTFTGIVSERTTDASDSIDGADVGSSGNSFAVPLQPGLEPHQSVNNGVAPAGLAWKIITLPISVISGSLRLVSGVIGIGLWAAGGVLSYSLSMLRLNGESSSRSSAAVEAVDFIASFDRDYGTIRPNFSEIGFLDSLQQSRAEFKLMFVYIHSPDHPDTPIFCRRSLCSEVLVSFLNENFLSWGGSIRASDGFKMSNRFKALRFPFCAVVMAPTNVTIALVQQIEGPKSPEEMLTILQKVLEESGGSLRTARLEVEERINNARLRAEQDAAYRAALEADQAREHQRREEQERVEREAAEAIEKRKAEEEAQEREALEAVEKEAARTKLRQEKALLLGPEPEKGPNVTQVMVRFPSGERKERRFDNTTTVESLYDFVDSLDLLKTEEYNLVSNFPRVIYTSEKLSLSLQEAGLHPQSSLFIEVN